MGGWIWKSPLREYKGESAGGVEFLNCRHFLKEIQMGIRRRRGFLMFTFPLRGYKGKSAGGGEFLDF